MQHQHPEGLTLAELARALGRHRNTVAAWPSRGCPVVERADRDAGKAWRFDLADVVAWLEAEAARKASEPLRRRLEAAERAAPDPEDDTTEREARRRKRLAEARLLELDLKEREGELLSRSDVEAGWIALASATRTRILAAPNKLGQVVAQETEASVCAELIRAELHDALQELSEAEVVAP